MLADMTIYMTAAQHCTPQAFGAVGDGLADDSAALAAAIADGRPLHFGNAVYRIAAPVDVTLTGAASWHSDGARIIYDGPVAQNALRIEAAGFDFRLSGDLIVDAARLAFVALAVENGNPMPRPTLAMTGIHVRNAYRSSTAFARGDGLLIKGGWRTIYLERPIAANCVMAAGAGIMGVQGIFGITITYGTAYPDEITIIHPEISEVYCEDVTYPYDQDGLRIFTSEDSATDPMPWPTHFSVIGGRFHNCRGRSIKSQCELGVVQGAKFIRDKGWLDAPGGVPRLGNYEVDFQVGGGFLVDCEFHYRDYAPQALVLFSGTRETGGIDRLSSGGTMRGAKVFLCGTPVMSRLVAFSPYAADDFTVLVDDVQVLSAEPLADYVVRGSTSGSMGDEFITIRNFRGRLASGFAYLVGSGAADLAVRDSINLGAAVPLRAGASTGPTTVDRVLGAA